MSGTFDFLLFTLLSWLFAFASEGLFIVTVCDYTEESAGRGETACIPLPTTRMAHTPSQRAVPTMFSAAACLICGFLLISLTGARMTGKMRCDQTSIFSSTSTTLAVNQTNVPVVADNTFPYLTHAEAPSWASDVHKGYYVLPSADDEHTSGFRLSDDPPTIAQAIDSISNSFQTSNRSHLTPIPANKDVPGITKIDEAAMECTYHHHANYTSFKATGTHWHGGLKLRMGMPYGMWFLKRDLEACTPDPVYLPITHYAQWWRGQGPEGTYPSQGTDTNEFDWGIQGRFQFHAWDTNCVETALEDAQGPVGHCVEVSRVGGV